MSNLGTMVAEIRSEIRRSGMDSAIKNSICAAVMFHRDKRFRWNELSFTFSTVANQQEYGASDSASIGLLATIDSLKITSPELPLVARDINWVRDRVEQVSGTPTSFAFYQKEIWLDPKPSQVFTVDVLGVEELIDTNQAASAQSMSRTTIAKLPDNYSTAWFTDGYDVIKTWAKGYLNLHHLRNQGESAAMFGTAGDLSSDQQNQINMVGGSSFARPTKF